MIGVPKVGGEEKVRSAPWRSDNEDLLNRFAFETNNIEISTSLDCFTLHGWCVCLRNQVMEGGVCSVILDAGGWIPPPVCLLEQQRERGLLSFSQSASGSQKFTPQSLGLLSPVESLPTHSKLWPQAFRGSEQHPQSLKKFS